MATFFGLIILWVIRIPNWRLGLTTIRQITLCPYFGRNHPIFRVGRRSSVDTPRPEHMDQIRIRKSNPFAVTKAVDLTDEEIQQLWVSVKANDNDVFRPTSPMPLFLLGG